jgi:hypothetical protein
MNITNITNGSNMDYSKLRRNVGLEILIFLFFLMPYLATGWPAYFIAIFYIIKNHKSKSTYSITAIVFSIFVIAVYLIKYFEPDNFALVRYLQVYFGFILFYFMFRSEAGTVDKNRLAIMMSLFVIVEAILINTIVPPTLLGNFVSENGELASTHITKYFGFYQRPYGYGANASMTSTMLVAIYSLLDKAKIKRIVELAIVLSLSTTGIMLLALTIFLKSKKKLVIGIIGLLLFISSGIILSQIDPQLAYRMSIDYIVTILEFTIEGNSTLLRPDDFSLWIGSNYIFNGIPIYLTDNGIAPLFYTNGIFLTLALIGTIYWPSAIKEKLPFIILFLGVLHYPAINTMVGQVLFALLLANKFSPALKIRAPLGRSATAISNAPINVSLAQSKQRL